VVVVLVVLVVVVAAAVVVTHVLARNSKSKNNCPAQQTPHLLIRVVHSSLSRPGHLEQGGNNSNIEGAEYRSFGRLDVQRSCIHEFLRPGVRFECESEANACEGRGAPVQERVQLVGPLRRMLRVERAQCLARGSSACRVVAAADGATARRQASANRRDGNVATLAVCNGEQRGSRGRVRRASAHGRPPRACTECDAECCSRSLQESTKHNIHSRNPAASQFCLKRFEVLQYLLQYLRIAMRYRYCNIPVSKVPRVQSPYRYSYTGNSSCKGKFWNILPVVHHRLSPVNTGTALSNEPHGATFTFSATLLCSLYPLAKDAALDAGTT
jgi:hypothetical protein